MTYVAARLALDMRFINRIDGEHGIDVPSGTWLMSYSGNYAMTSSGGYTGTISGFQQTHDGALVFTATDVNASAARLLPPASTFDGDTFLKVAFAGNDTIEGSRKADYLLGEAGRDILSGGAGKDILHGGAGNDALHGGTGKDMLFGDRGADTFFFETGQAAKGDIIADFDGRDTIDLSGIDADTTRPGNQSFAFLDTWHPGQGLIAYLPSSSGSEAFLLCYTDGDNMADFTITVRGSAYLGLAESDIIL